MSEAFLSLGQIHKRFGRFEALRDVSLSVRSGRIHALLGENGAGKSTLMRIAYGMMSPDSGNITRDGARCVLRSPRDAIALGIGMVHQHFMLIPAMSVAENIGLGMSQGVADPRVRMVLERREDALAHGLDPQRRVGTLSVAAQQRVEILKALARDATVLILDEPTAVLAPDDAAALLGWLRRYAAGGRSAILVTHKLQEAMAVADDISVLHRGRMILQASAVDVSPAQVVRAMLGDVAPQNAASASADSGTGVVVVRARAVQVTDAHGTLRLHDASFDIRAGEIVGVAAVEGAGQRELLRAAAGRIQISGGSLDIPATIGFVPEDRHRDAQIAEFTLVENLALLEAGSRRGWMHWAAVEKQTRGMLALHGVRATGPRATASTLSGGNQQKFVLAREMSNAPALLVAENPTRGLDIRATRTIVEQLRQARAEGMAILLHSGDLDELLALSSRMLVVHAGVVREVRADYATVGKAMLGAA